MAVQKKRKFDPVTRRKIRKGAAYATSGAVGMLALGAIRDTSAQDQVINAVVTWLIPTLVNLLKEWLSGEE